MSSHQVSLFDSGNDLIEKLDRRVSKIDWSYSKRNVLETCVRKYFYQYYGHKLRNPYLHKDELRFYKKMSNHFLISGDITHLMIKNYLDNFQSDNERKWNAKRLKSWSKDIIRKYLNFSFNYKKGVDDELKFPPPLIQEMFFEYPDYLELYEIDKVNEIAILR